MSILEVSNLKKVYVQRLGGSHVQALSNVTFSVEEGEYVAIMGESGSGKTTLLNILAAFDRPTNGEVKLGGKNMNEISEKEISAFRRENLGFVFQDFNLLDTFSLKENIFLPLVLSGKKYQEMSTLLAPVARRLGITDLLQKYPYEVSGGQKQRAAVARAVITQPKLILADCWISSGNSMGKDRRFSWLPTQSKRRAEPTGCCLSGTEKYFIRFIKRTVTTSRCISSFPILSPYLRQAVIGNEKELLSETCSRQYPKKRKVLSAVSADVHRRCSYVFHHVQYLHQ